MNILGSITVDNWNFFGILNSLLLLVFGIKNFGGFSIVGCGSTFSKDRVYSRESIYRDDAFINCKVRNYFFLSQVLAEVA
jgi:hypothetical protein